ncbi:MAG: DUF4062 domain-containing protein [Firmicutes bacterium]|nr:DUF4062 domain-containing protein [Bacillota bacterium]
MKKYQVFVSSTYDDLKQERKAVLEKISELGQIPMGMEYFSASNSAQWDLIEKQIKCSDYMVIILGGRYGSYLTNDLEKKSYCRREYDLAIKEGIPVLAFFKSDLKEQIEDNPLLKEFYEDIKIGNGNGRECAFWKNKKELCEEVIKALAIAFIDTPRKGWKHTENNIYMRSRKELQSDLAIGERLGMYDKRYKAIRKIKIMNLAGNLMVNPNIADYGHLTDMGKIKLADAMKKILEETPAIVHLILAEPNEHNIYDLPFKIFNSRPQTPEMCLFSALEVMQEMLTNGSIYQKAWEKSADIQSQFEFGVAKFVIPYAIFNVEFTDKYKYYNHVKVDLYCPALGDEDERRSFIIYQREDPENYKFFVDNFDRIAKNQRLCKKVIPGDFNTWKAKKLLP